MFGFDWLYREKGWEIPVVKKENEMKKQEVVLVRLASPVWDGMLLALGFFLMGIVLTFIGYAILGVSCATLLSSV